MRIRLLVAALAALALTGTARAQVISMRFGSATLPNPAFGTTTLSAPAGSTINLFVYFTDSDTTVRTQGGMAAIGTGLLSSNAAVADFTGGTADVVANVPPGTPGGEFSFATPHVNDATIGSPGRASIQDTGIAAVP